MEEIWKAGYRTVGSCQCHAITGKIWIQFGDPWSAQGFLNIVAPQQDADPGSTYRRIRHWLFTMYQSGSISWNTGIVSEKQRADSAWEFYIGIDDEYDRRGSAVEFGFHISVLFPQKDLPAVLQRMREHNATGQSPPDPESTAMTRYPDQGEGG